MSEINEYQYYQQILEDTLPFNWVSKIIFNFLTDNSNLNLGNWTENQIFAILLLDFLKFSVSGLDQNDQTKILSFLKSNDSQTLENTLGLAIQTALETDIFIIVDYFGDLAMRLNAFLVLDTSANTYGLYSQLWDYANDLKNVYTEYKNQINIK